MARQLDALAAHWLARKGQQRKKTIPLGDGEFTFYWSAWTLGQQDYVYHDAKPGEPFRPERMARVVCRKAEKENGERMFADIEMVDLMTNVDPEVETTMALAIILDLQDDSAAGQPEGGDDPKARIVEGNTTIM